MVDNRVYCYIRVDGDSLQNINNATKKIWEEAINDEYGLNDIIDISKNEKNKSYLVNETIYHNLIQASVENSEKEPYGIENVNFSMITKTDFRWEEFQKQRLERGFDDSELWNLDSTIAKFILPRLKAFAEINTCYPSFLNEDEWRNILSKIIKTFEYITEGKFESDIEHLPKEDKIYQETIVIKEGLKLFIEYYSYLWL